MGRERGCCGSSFKGIGSVKKWEEFKQITRREEDISDQIKAPREYKASYLLNHNQSSR